MNIVVFAASDLEYNTVKASLTDWKTTDYYEQLLAGQGYSGENLVELFCTKMGPKNATEQSIKALEKSKGKIVLITGLAGGLATKYKQGDLVIYNSCYFLGENQTQPNKVDCDQKLTNFLSNSLRLERITTLEGNGLTFPKVVCQAQEKLSLAKKYNAVAVDMESYQILIAAKEKRLPATVLRVISDDAQGDLPDLNAAMNQNGDINNLKMIWQFAQHPVLAAKFLINLNKSISVLKTYLPKVLGRNFAELY
ncbi:MAG: hypothetical protein FD167_2597 [bacterium]|nr:MAG: hypothetical protein FD167_2597 [bacterium]